MRYHWAGLALDLSGNPYGTTTAGGASPFLHGTVFKVNGTSEIVLYDFTGGANGRVPGSSVILDTAGNIYGTTVTGGANGVGTVFKLIP